MEWERDMVKGCKIRAGKVVDEGHERVTTFHINAERERTVNSKIEQLEVDGRVLVGKDGVAEGLLQHFKSVFQRGENTNSSGREGFLEVIRERVNMEGDRQDGVITMDELKFALGRTKKDKSPGIDGISYEFYIEFFQTVGPTMVEMMNMSIRRRKLEKSQGLAVIKLLPKKKNAIRPSDFRSISLLCTDYKLLSGILAERLKTTLPESIGGGQRGGVPGRKIFNSLTLFRDFIERINELKERGGKIGAALVAIDLEKAYDFVDRNALWTIMDAMGYSRQFTDMLRTLYNNCDMQIMNCGDECGTIVAKNSIRQGCPLSMHLFVIYLEPLLVNLEQDLGVSR